MRLCALLPRWKRGLRITFGRLLNCYNLKPSSIIPTDVYPVSDDGEYAINEQRKRCFAVVEAKMKLLIFLAISLNQLAWSQLQTGTVIYINVVQGEVTISADSRMNIIAGGHDDTECKIFAFGSKFVFSMAGAARIDQWNAHSVAREIWERESKIHSDTTLLARTVKGWIEAVEPIYGIHVAEIRKHMNSGDAPVIATAFFAAADKAGTIKVQAVDIVFDLQLFDSTGRVKVLHKIGEIPTNSSASMGHDEIAMEFHFQTTQRAKDYMAWFKRRIATLPPDQQYAELASKYIELSILLHSKNSELAFPVDVLQLRKDTGVRWIYRKDNCPEK
jgi:hypothetical protein